jgi:hypothetical protein
MVLAFHFYSFFMLGLCLVGALVIGLFVRWTCAGNTGGGRVGQGTDVAFDRDIDRMAVFRVATSVGSGNMQFLGGYRRYDAV